MPAGGGRVVGAGRARWATAGGPRAAGSRRSLPEQNEEASFLEENEEAANARGVGESNWPVHCRESRDSHGARQVAT